MECIFCKIAKKEVPSNIVFESDDVVAFKDINPIAPVHVLVIPKKHIKSIVQIKNEDVVLMGNIVVASKKIAENMGISEGGYKLLFRVGKNGGQEVDHIHMHLIGGARLCEKIKPA